MSILNNSNAIESGGYQISNSLRFQRASSQYLNRTPASASNRKTMTFSFWRKLGSLPSAEYMVAAGGTTGDVIRFAGGYQLQFYLNNGSSAQLVTNQLFRDPSAWYHFVCVVDTSNATSTERLRIYVNGERVTSLASASYPSLNYDCPYFNNTSAHYIGGVPADVNYVDGYMTEVNFIDGQALTPSSFGETNTLTGQWVAKKYTGTYGTNGFYLPFTANTTPTYDGSFNGSTQKLTVPASSNFAPGTGDFTVEGWFNTSSLPSYLGVLYSQAASGTNYFLIGAGDNNLSPSNKISFIGTSSGGGVAILSGSNTFQFNTWNHFAVVRQSGVVTVYLNGIGGTPTSNTTNFNDTTMVPTIGQYTHSTSNAFAGRISNFRYVKGVALYTSNFTPSTSPLTAVTGTQLLTLQNSTIIDNSPNALTITNTGGVTTSIQYPFGGPTSIFNDASGNGNNWTPTNMSTIAGVNQCSMIDVPSGNGGASGTQPNSNYAVLNPLDKGSSLTVANANLNASTGATWNIVRGTIGVSSGKWYWEQTLTSGTNGLFGIAGVVSNLATNLGVSASDYGYQGSGNKWNNNTSSAYGATFTTNDVIGVAFDADAGTITFYKNNTSQGVAYSGIPAGTYFPAVSMYGSTVATNLGQRSFAYTPPSGFVALCTANLPVATIKRGNQYMDATLYTGIGATQTITGYNFQPELVWVKARSAAYDHKLVDVVRGLSGSIYRDLESNTTDAEGTPSDGISSLNSNGFTITGGGNPGYNGNTTTFVAWAWDAGSSTVTNTSGTISSQVRANPTAGVSIVTYTGNGVTSATVGHGLGVAPKMLIHKCRSSTGAWKVNHVGIPNQWIDLNLTDAASSGGGTNGSIGYQSTNTSTTFQFTAGSSSVNNVNANGSTYVAYCFAEIAGFSKFGSYTGNGSTDGPMVYLGFQPKYWLVKRTDGADDWFVFDSAREPSNSLDLRLCPNGAFAEASTTTGFDFLANGVKVRSSSAAFNASGGTYIYMAFASNPFAQSNSF